MSKTVRQFGAIFSKKDVRDYRIAKVTNPSEFPEEFELTNLPEIKNQRSVGSCVAHAVSEAIEWNSKQQGDTSEPMSTGFIYGNRTNSINRGAGMIVRDAISVTRKYGDLTYVEYPYNEEVPTAINRFNKIPDETLAQAYKNRFTSYCALLSESEIKTALLKGNIVVFAMPWYDDIKVVKGVMQSAQQNSVGGHCMLLYGWNKTGWKIQNSWGKSWGVGGRAILPYSIKVREFWAIKDDYSEAKTQQQIDNLIVEMAELSLQLPSAINADEIVKKIEALQKEQRQLEEQLLQIRKPYNSLVGNFIAKIFNGLINVFYSVVNFIRIIISK